MASRKMSIEAALERLQKITELLEQGELSLDESLKLYEEGVGLTKTCKKMLDEAELKITVLSAESGTGEQDG
ncbi:MAG: exodeoxyribonuclease VII small subunit [Oscillospiraceae bacterium]|jgi:exodeoxyribonuclease VII small subunit